MPSTSKSQHALMEMAAHDPAAAARLGIKAGVAKEFVAADKGRSLNGLPQHVPHKACGGAIAPTGYPKKFDW